MTIEIGGGPGGQSINKTSSGVRSFTSLEASRDSILSSRYRSFTGPADFELNAKSHVHFSSTAVLLEGGCWNRSALTSQSYDYRLLNLLISARHVNEWRAKPESKEVGKGTAEETQPEEEVRQEEETKGGSGANQREG